VPLLNALTGIDPRDRATQGSRGKSHADYTRFLDPQGLRGARLGVARKFFGFSDRVDKLMSDAIDALKQAGAIIIDPANLPSHGKYDDSEFEVLLYEFKADLNKYLAERGAGVPRSLKEIIDFNERNREKEMPYFGQEIMLKAQAKGPLTSKAYLAALAKNHRLSRAEGIDAVMLKHRLDAIIAPTGRPGVDNRSRQRRPLLRQQFHPGGGRRIPEHQCSGGLRLRSARRHLLLRQRLQRTCAHQAGLRFRATDQTSPPAAVQQHRAAQGMRAKG
jgi:Asp-tRNA(Asn)/Glu-tRNA(Gln) amidotransferase A subunit family amidase